MNSDCMGNSPKLVSTIACSRVSPLNSQPMVILRIPVGCEHCENLPLYMAAVVAGDAAPRPSAGHLPGLLHPCVRSAQSGRGAGSSVHVRSPWPQPGESSWTQLTAVDSSPEATASAEYHHRYQLHLHTLFPSRHSWQAVSS